MVAECVAWPGGGNNGTEFGQPVPAWVPCSEWATVRRTVAGRTAGRIQQFSPPRPRVAAARHPTRISLFCFPEYSVIMSVVCLYVHQRLLLQVAVE